MRKSHKLPLAPAAWFTLASIFAVAFSAAPTVSQDATHTSVSDLALVFGEGLSGLAQRTESRLGGRAAFALQRSVNESAGPALRDIQVLVDRWYAIPAWPDSDPAAQEYDLRSLEVIAAEFSLLPAISQVRLLSIFQDRADRDFRSAENLSREDHQTLWGEWVGRLAQATAVIRLAHPVDFASVAYRDIYFARTVFDATGYEYVFLSGAGGLTHEDKTPNWPIAWDANGRPKVAAFVEMPRAPNGALIGSTDLCRDLMLFRQLSSVK